MIDLTDVFEFFQTIYACIPAPIFRLLGILAFFTVFIYIRNVFVKNE